jgi:uncharacterized OB-fold protein
MRAFVVSSCDACGWRGFPIRLWCPSCGDFEPSTALVETGTVAQVTTVTYAIGRELAVGVRVANVEFDGGAFIARLEGEPTGSVTVVLDDGVPVAVGSAGTASPSRTPASQPARRRYPFAYWV